MTHKEMALDYFDRKFHCSQAVLAAFKDEVGLTEQQALKPILRAEKSPIRLMI